MVAVLRGDPQIMVIGEALTVDQAVAMTWRHLPQVVAMGIHLPAEGGLEAAKRIMIEVPTPIVIVANGTDAAQAQMSALRAGALAVVPQPWTARRPGSDLETQRFVSTIKALSQVKVIHHRYGRQDVDLQVATRSNPSVPVKVVAVAASTGGPAALQELLSALPADFPVPILVVQHISPGFVHGLAATLDTACPLTVRVAVDGEPLLPHTVLMAPDGLHLGVTSRSRVALLADAPLSGFRPSATVLFESVARTFGAAAAHVILTGMGRDGVAGLAVARALGGRVFAQDAASSVVFGMPGEAVNAGVVDSVGSLASIADQLVALTQAVRS